MSLLHIIYITVNPKHIKWHTNGKSSVVVIFLYASHLIFHLTPPFSCPLPPPPHPTPFHCLLCSVLPLCGCPPVLQALAQAIKEAKEQHPDMSVTRVVVHKETELAEEED